MARSSHSYPCPFKGCTTTTETADALLAHFKKKHIGAMEKLVADGKAGKAHLKEWRKAHPKKKKPETPTVEAVPA